MLIGNDDDYLTVHELSSWFLGRPGINLMSLGLAPAKVWEEEKKTVHITKPPNTPRVTDKLVQHNCGV